MDDKRTKIKESFRADVEDDILLEKRAKRLNINKSECIRQLIHGTLHEPNKSQEAVSQICKVFTLCMRILEACDMKESDKQMLLEEANQLCKK